MSQSKTPLLDRVRAPEVLLGCDPTQVLEVDGRRVPLMGVTSRRALVRGGPVELRPCDPAAAALSAGVHRLVAPVGDFAVARLTAGTRPDEESSATRSLALGHWTEENRVIEVGPGAASYLALAENQNDGWRATLEGRELRALRLDGWRQAWQVPAGEGGTISLVFEPARSYRMALVTGLGAALLLFAFLALPSRRRPTPAEPAHGWVLPAVLVVAALTLVAGPWGLLAAGLGMVLVHRWTALVPYVAGGALTLAALITAWQLRWPMPWPVLPAAVAQALALSAVGALVAEVFLPRLLGRGPARAAPPAPPAAGGPTPRTPG